MLLFLTFFFFLFQILDLQQSCGILLILYPSCYVYLSSRKRYPGAPNSPTNFEIGNILALPQKMALTYATCVVCFFVLTSPNIIPPEEKILDISHCFQQCQHLVHPAVALLKAFRYGIWVHVDLAGFCKWLPSSVAQTQNLSLLT